MNLAETQALFSTSLQSGGSDAQRARALGLIREGGGIPPELALQIYENNVRGACVKALTAAYPACRRVLGERCFNGLAHRFVAHTPSKETDLNGYGASFGAFLDDCTATQSTLADYPYLGDLARLEWLCHRAYYAADDPPFDFQALAAAGGDAQQGLRFRLGRSVGLLQSDWPVMTVRALNLSDDAATQVQAEALPEYLVVSRPAFQPQVERVDANTFRLLAACRDGRTLADIAATDEHGGRAVTEALPGLIQRRRVVGFTRDSTAEERVRSHA